MLRESDAETMPIATGGTPEAEVSEGAAALGEYRYPSTFPGKRAMDILLRAIR